MKFSYGSVTIEGNMEDISGSGVSLISELLPATNADQGGMLHFTLAGTPLKVVGTFVRAMANGSDGYICIFQMKPDRMTDNIIGRYIYQRQVEIIQQLKEGLVVE